MKMLAVVISAILPSAALAQQAGPGASQAAIRQAITALEERIGQANFDCDYKFFANVEGSEFIFTNGAGAVTTRTEDLAGEKDCHASKGTYVLDEVRVISLGNVVVFSARAVTTTNGASVQRKQRFTDVLVWRDSRWQLIAGHASRIP